MIKFPVPIGENNKIVIIGGINVLESIDLAYKVANEFKRTCEILKLPYIFKASFDKANRSSIDSYRGPGLEKGLKMLKEIKETLKVPILTDIHESFQAKKELLTIKHRRFLKFSKTIFNLQRSEDI